MEEITIPFQTVRAEKLHGLQKRSKEIHEEVHDVYTGRYLEALGVQPTKANRQLVVQHAPLGSCEIQAAWADTRSSVSAVADTLRIVQPMSGQTQADQKYQLGIDSKQFADEAALRSRVDRKHLQYTSTAVPEIPTAWAMSDFDDKENQVGTDTLMAAMEKMRKADHAASQNLDKNATALTLELERVRSQARLDKQGEDDKETGTEERDRQEKELSKLKLDFILPFACERSKSGSERIPRMVPWQHLQSRQAIEVPDQLHSEAAEPIVVTLEAIHEETLKYSERLPLELLTYRQEPALFAPVRARLVLAEAVRLTGLLAHLLYWVIFKHLHPEEKQLPDSSIQALQVTIHDLWTELLGPVRDFPMGVSFLIPLLFLSIKHGMQWIFLTKYPSVFACGRTCRHLTEQINVLLMQLFDPDCVYARFGVLDSSKQALKLWRKYDLALASKGQGNATRMINRKNRTTPAVNTFMGPECSGRPGNAKTRRLLAKSASDTVLAASTCRHGTSKAAEKNWSTTSQPKKPPMDELKQEALLKIACKKLSRSSSQAMTFGPGAATANRALVRASAARLASTGPEGRGSSANGRTQRSLRQLAGRGMSPVREKRPTTIEFTQRYAAT
jgi:hypothetical protein